jgi:hypothetical protein
MPTKPVNLHTSLPLENIMLYILRYKVIYTVYMVPVHISHSLGIVKPGSWEPGSDIDVQKAGYTV